MGLTGALMRAYDDPTDPPSGVPGVLLKHVPCRSHNDRHNVSHTIWSEQETMQNALWAE